MIKCSSKWMIFCSCIWSIIIAGIVMFALSFSIVELDEWGIKYDTTWQEVYSEPKSSGRYFLGLGKQFIIYPRKMITILFNNETSAQANSLEAWTKDGLNVNLDLSLFLRLNETRLRPDWYAYLVRSVYSNIKRTTIQFETIRFITDRMSINSAFETAVKTDFERISQGAIIMEDLQLRYIGFESVLESSILTKLIQSQQKKTAIQVNQTKYIQKQTEQAIKGADNQILTNNADAQLQAIVIETEAKANYFGTIFTAMAINYKNLLDALNVGKHATNHLQNNQDRIQFIYANEIAQIDQDVRTFVGFKQSMVST